MATYRIHACAHLCKNQVSWVKTPCAASASWHPPSGRGHRPPFAWSGFLWLTRVLACRCELTRMGCPGSPTSGHSKAKRSKARVEQALNSPLFRHPSGTTLPQSPREVMSELNLRPSRQSHHLLPSLPPQPPSLLPAAHQPWQSPPAPAPARTQARAGCPPAPEQGQAHPAKAAASRPALREEGHPRQGPLPPGRLNSLAPHPSGLSSLGRDESACCG